MTSSAVQIQLKMSAASAVLYKLGAVVEQVSEETIQKLPTMKRMKDATETRSLTKRTRASSEAFPTRRLASEAARASSSALRRKGRGVTAV